MQAVLSFEQAPPIAAPFRFFLTAPLFAALAGVLLAVDGPAVLASRWSPGALALTHLIAVGFVLQVMVGAMIQVLPVVAGANLRHPLLVARIVHLLLVAGVLALVAGFLGWLPGAFTAAMLLLGGGLGFFLVMGGLSLIGVPSTSPSVRGFKLALFSLGGVLLLGIALAGALGGRWSLTLAPFLQAHINWAFAAWGLGLLSAVAYVVVPMFQLTPAYPLWFSRPYDALLLACVAALTLALAVGGETLALLLQFTVIALAAVFCALTLRLQAKSKRARLDATQRLWRSAMLCGLAACALAAAAPLLPGSAAMPLALGALILVCGFMSVIVGMLYKIVPFLVWLHLQNRGQGKVIAPNMKQVLAEAPMLRHYRAHLAACALLLAAACWPEWLARPAGLALLVASGMLAHNLWAAVTVYREHAAKIDARLAELGAAAGKEIR